MRTARSITSGENFGDFLIAPFSIEGASSISGAIHIPAIEWEWVCRWLDSGEGDPRALLNRLVVELLYFAELKLVEIVELSSHQLAAPANKNDAWALTLLAKNGRARYLRYIPEQLSRTLLMWLGSGPTWTAFQRGKPLLDMSVDCIRDELQGVFKGAADLADSCNEVDIAEGLRKRTAMSLRHAYRAHRKDTLMESYRKLVTHPDRSPSA